MGVEATLPEKVKFYIWLILDDSLPINLSRFHGKVFNTIECDCCNHDVKDILHCPL